MTKWDCKYVYRNPAHLKMTTMNISVKNILQADKNFKNSLKLLLYYIFFNIIDLLSFLYILIKKPWQGFALKFSLEHALYRNFVKYYLKSVLTDSFIELQCVIYLFYFETTLY